jgi:hypothetical protein
MDALRADQQKYLTKSEGQKDSMRSEKPMRFFQNGEAITQQYGSNLSIQHQPWTSSDSALLQRRVEFGKPWVRG